MRLIVPAWMLAAVCVGLVSPDKVRADDARYSQPSDTSQSSSQPDTLWPAGAPNLAPIRQAVPLVQKVPTADAPNSQPVETSQPTRPDTLWPAGAPNLAFNQDSAVQPTAQSAPASAPKLALYSPPIEASQPSAQPDRL